MESSSEPRLNRRTSSHSQVSTHSTFILVLLFSYVRICETDYYLLPIDCYYSARAQSISNHNHHLNPRLDSNIYILFITYYLLTCDFVQFIPPFSDIDSCPSTLLNINNSTRGIHITTRTFNLFSVACLTALGCVTCFCRANRPFSDEVLISTNGSYISWVAEHHSFLPNSLRQYSRY